MDIASTAPAIDPEDQPETKHREAAPEGSFWRRLLHRWFVEYNPLYLVSALLVLGGLTLISRGTAESSSAHREVAVAAIAEVYACALIAGAALLTRIGLRRPAVMLCLVTALYQCDLTLLTERQVYLGFTGVAAVTAWLVMFGVKLHALAWAMRLRLSRSAIAVPAFGALGMAVLPHVLPRVDASQRSVLVAAWVFALFAGGLWTSREVTSTVGLDAWGRTVLARTLKAIWALWGTLALFHVLFWCSQSSVRIGVLLPVAFLLATRRLRTDAAVWAAVTGALLYTGACESRHLWLVSLFAATTLALRALRRPTVIERAVDAPADATPYRAPGTDAPAPEAPPVERILGFARSERAPMVRLLGGSMFAVYLSAWTFQWTGGALPPHTLVLDAMFLAGAVMMVWKARTRAILAPLAWTWVHAGVQSGLISAPTSTLQWGIASVGTGFVLLLGSLVIAWRLRGTEPVVVPPGR